MVEEKGYRGDGTYGGKSVYEYDDNGNVIMSNWVDAENIEHKSTYKYTYDSMQNWIEKVEFRAEVPQKITERQIVYFG
jgi:hypothetical protein